MTGDPRLLEWARRIAGAYIEEVLPGNGGVPASRWNFTTHSGDGRLRLRDHGNETVVGLTMLFTLEHALQTPRAERYAPVIQRMLDRILASANGDGLLYNEIDAAALHPLDESGNRRRALSRVRSTAMRTRSKARSISSTVSQSRRRSTGSILKPT